MIIDNSLIFSSYKSTVRDGIDFQQQETPKKNSQRYQPIEPK